LGISPPGGYTPASIEEASVEYLTLGLSVCLCLLSLLYSWNCDVADSFD